MFRKMQEFDPGFPGCPEGPCHDGEKGGQGGRAVVSSVGAGSGVLPEGDDEFASESQIESAAAACVLWSTVGVGCLIGRRPKSSVSRLLDCCRWRIRPTLIAVVGGLLSRQHDGGRRGCCLWDDTLLSCVVVGRLTVSSCIHHQRTSILPST